MAQGTFVLLGFADNTTLHHTHTHTHTHTHDVFADKETIKFAVNPTSFEGAYLYIL